MERTTFRREFCETLLRLLRHLIFVFLLAGRLYTLPLLYIAHSLATPNNPWYLTN
jgi:hypothetical protein